LLPPKAAADRAKSQVAPTADYRLETAEPSRLRTVPCLARGALAAQRLRFVASPEPPVATVTAATGAGAAFPGYAWPRVVPVASSAVVFVATEHAAAVVAQVFPVAVARPAPGRALPRVRNATQELVRSAATWDLLVVPAQPAVQPCAAAQTASAVTMSAWHAGYPAVPVVRGVSAKGQAAATTASALPRQAHAARQAEPAKLAAARGVGLRANPAVRVPATTV
jgi:hypothetical protein